MLKAFGSALKKSLDTLNQQSVPKPGEKEYKSVIVFDTKSTASGMFGDPVGNEINKWGKKGWILESDELITKGSMLSASRRRLTFSKGSTPVAQVAANQPASVADELTKLKQLKDQGIISDDEFEAQKSKLLE